MLKRLKSIETAIESILIAINDKSNLDSFANIMNLWHSMGEILYTILPAKVDDCEVFIVSLTGGFIISPKFDTFQLTDNKYTNIILFLF